jgi:hypothetical protein
VKQARALHSPDSVPDATDPSAEAFELASGRLAFMEAWYMYSPATIREAKWREKVKQDEAEAEKLQKKTTRELKAAHNLCKTKMKEEAKALRESAAAARKKDPETRAAERAAEKERKQQERDAATAQKSRDSSNKASQTSS